ncbi:MAG: 3-oxoacyl-[acyl-carrier-protein] reductase [Defluviitaleaceae bacterium]|nr:3-oxoacyl-[acyl-carrier-protein] reductase [Defluviitaleaceae bacterium]
MLKGKTVLITGATRGIGKNMAEAFAKEGANIVLNYRGEEPLELAKEIEAFGVSCLLVKADVSNFSECETMISKAVETFKTVDVLINNAGITKDGLIMRMSEDDFSDVLDINLKGVFNTIRHASKIMLKQKSGAIINISSVVGIMGNAGQANYVASKAGVIGLTKTVARELGSRGITCNAIAPGFIETDMTDVLKDEVKQIMLNQIPLNRFGACEDISETAIFLAKSKYITGQTINVCGGMLMN